MKPSPRMHKVSSALFFVSTVTPRSSARFSFFSFVLYFSFFSLVWFVEICKKVETLPDKNTNNPMFLLHTLLHIDIIFRKDIINVCYSYYTSCFCKTNKGCFALFSCLDVSVPRTASLLWQYYRFSTEGQQESLISLHLFLIAI